LVRRINSLWLEFNEVVGREINVVKKTKTVVMGAATEVFRPAVSVNLRWMRGIEDKIIDRV